MNTIIRHFEYKKIIKICENSLSKTAKSVKNHIFVASLLTCDSNKKLDKVKHINEYIYSLGVLTKQPHEL